jgi:hypothetical protein
MIWSTICYMADAAIWNVYGTRRMSGTDLTMADSSWTMQSQLSITITIFSAYKYNSCENWTVDFVYSNSIPVNWTSSKFSSTTIKTYLLDTPTNVNNIPFSSLSYELLVSLSATCTCQVSAVCSIIISIPLCAVSFWRSYTYPSPFIAMNLQFLCTATYFKTPTQTF